MGDTLKSPTESGKESMRTPVTATNNFPSNNRDDTFMRSRSLSVNRRQLQDYGLGSHSTSGIISAHTPEYYLNNNNSASNNYVGTMSTTANNSTLTSIGDVGTNTDSVLSPILMSNTIPPSQVVESLITDQNNKTLNALEHSYQTGDLRSRERSASQRKLSDAAPLLSPNGPNAPPLIRNSKADALVDRSSVSSPTTASLDSGDFDMKYYERLKSMNSLHVNDPGSRDFMQQQSSGGLLVNSNSFGISTSIDYQERVLSLTPSNVQGVPNHSNVTGLTGNLGIAGGDDDSERHQSSSMHPFDNSRDQYYGSGASVTSVEDAEEDYYSKLKNEAMKLGKKSSNSNSRSLGEEFKPASNFLQLSRNAIGTSGRQYGHGASFMSDASVNSVATDQLKGNMIGKGAHERLYHSASLHRKKQAIREKQKVDEEKRRLDDEQFRLNDNSRRITEHLVKSRLNEGENIGQRLYQKGMKEIELKAKKEDEKKKKIEEIAKEGENWSCARCGTFHQVNVNVSSFKPKPKVCDQCGFNQSDVTPHKPCNIALKNYENAEEVLQHRQTLIQQVTSSANSQKPINSFYANPNNGHSDGRNTTSSVHEYLYRAKREDDILHTNRQLWQELNADMTFKPVIPESSKQILNKYKQAQRNDNGQGQSLECLDIQEVDDGDELVSQVSSVSGRVSENNRKDLTKKYNPIISKSHNPASKKLESSLTGMTAPSGKLSGDALREYVNKPATERLVTTTTAAALYNTIEKEQVNKNKIATKINGRVDRNKKSDTADAAVPQALPPQTDAFVNRLTYEYKTKDQKLKLEIEKRHKYDDKTGQELFRPKVEPVPEGLLYTGITTSSRYEGNGNIWDDILRRDAELQEKKKALQKKAIEKTLHELREHQVKALPTSNDILQKSTEKHLEDLFRILLASSIEEGQTTLETFDEEYRDYCESGRNGSGSSDQDYEKKSISEDDDEADQVAKLHKRAGEITDWRIRSLDLMKVNPTFMINEVSTLLMDMKTTMFLQWQKKFATAKGSQRMQSHQTGSEISEGEYEGLLDQYKVNKESPESLNITYDKFVKLAMKCIKQRDGPGRGYVFVAKKKPEIALELKEKEEREETFHPAIDKTSIEILNKNCRQLRLLSLPIETILQADGDRVKNKVEQERQKKILKEAEELTFKPKLFKPPSYVVPRYRGMDDMTANESASGRDDDGADSDEEPLLGEDMIPARLTKTRDDNSVRDFLKSAGNHQTFAIPFGESEGAKVCNLLKKGNPGTGGNGFFIRGGGSVVVSSSAGQQVIGSTHTQNVNNNVSAPSVGSNGSTSLNISGSAGSAQNVGTSDPFTPPKNPSRSVADQQRQPVEPANQSFISPVNDISASSLLCERVTPPSSSSLNSSPPVHMGASMTGIATPQSFVERTIVAGMNEQRARGTSIISANVSAAGSKADLNNTTLQHRQGKQLFVGDDEADVDHDGYGYGYQRQSGGAIPRYDHPMRMNELRLSDEGDKVHYASGGYAERALKQKSISNNRSTAGPPPLPSTTQYLEHPRSVSPDMSKFSDNTISTKSTIESRGNDSKTADTKNSYTYTGKHSQQRTNGQMPATSATNSGYGRNGTLKSGGSIASNNSRNANPVMSSKPATKSKQVPPPLPCERDRKKKEDGKYYCCIYSL